MKSTGTALRCGDYVRVIATEGHCQRSGAGIGSATTGPYPDSVRAAF